MPFDYAAQKTCGSAQGELNKKAAARTPQPNNDKGTEET
jgi:hypothetical protein